MKPLPASDRRHQRALRSAAMWIHPIATKLKHEAPVRSAALRTAARTCESMSSTATCMAVKKAVLALPPADGADVEAWMSGLVGALHGINLHAVRLGVDPYRDVETQDAAD